jgi:hypothetical protein
MRDERQTDRVHYERRTEELVKLLINHERVPGAGIVAAQAGRVTGGMAGLR